MTNTVNAIPKIDKRHDHGPERIHKVCLFLFGKFIVVDVSLVPFEVDLQPPPAQLRKVPCFDKVDDFAMVQFGLHVPTLLSFRLKYLG
ncbi:hypothetical protein [Loktanella salsilacus]|uniref:hypothetical protein n=1 Tax=Loktanella salsilacus TaxID=195913 RepID=UPI0037048850